ncbi:MAG: EI24 domain-containing protein [Flavihumibacter sp.]|nr:EI24 domain-containing protein [Flavihumibacter sp.]
MLKELIIAFESFYKAHHFIVQHKLWRWILIPGIIYMLLFVTGMYFFISSANDAVNYLTNLIGIDRWLQEQKSGILSFLFMMGGIMVQVLLVFFYFSFFKFFFLIVGSPVFAYLSEKTESIIEGRDFPFSFKQLLKLALRNLLWQTVYTVSILLLSFVPLVGWISPLISLFVECYYYGFSMVDYSCERRKLSPAESIRFISEHKGLAIGNGLLFYLMHAIPFVGWVLAPSYAVIAATLSFREMEKK